MGVPVLGASSRCGGRLQGIAGGLRIAGPDERLLERVWIRDIQFIYTTSDHQRRIRTCAA